MPWSFVTVSVGKAKISYGIPIYQSQLLLVYKGTLYLATVFVKRLILTDPRWTDRTGNTKEQLTCREKTWLPRGGGGVGMNWGFRIDAYTLVWTSQVGLVVKTPPAKAGGIKTQVWSLGLEDTLEEGTAAHSSILAWKVPWTEEPESLLSMGSQRVGHNWIDLAHTWKVWL